MSLTGWEQELKARERKKKKKKAEEQFTLQAASRGTRALAWPLTLLSLCRPGVSPRWQRSVLRSGMMRWAYFWEALVFLCCLVHALHSVGGSVDTGLRAHGADGLRRLRLALTFPRLPAGALATWGTGGGCVCFPWSPEFLLLETIFSGS